ncbi:hypothetical protein [Fluviispira multicolorata]|uniref:Uncharacterized protein n=1 Tax=Fluviispira multicolorata TaxID=2654512 RepID=A0A833JCR1_9BACT|nr:hypothetical protein [Fluviispira multicolorata]KAB8029802.1 hypothetical protein GCL57_09685 [Fluviispira multicolorata]
MFRARSPMIKRTDKMTSFITVLWRYIIYSSLFWSLISLFFLIVLYDSTYGEKSYLSFFSSFNLTIQFIGIILIIIIFSGILGGTLSLPAIFLKILMKVQEDKKLRKGQRPVIFTFAATYLPILFCVYIHFMALLISTSAAPQMMRKWFDKNSYIYELQESFYNKLYEIKKTEIYNKWNIIGKNSEQNSKFIFLVPDYLLTHNNSFRESKLLLKNENNWFLYSPTKASISATILGDIYLTDERLFTPAPLQSFQNINRSKSELKEETNKYFIGINGKSSFTFSQIFNKNRISNNINPSWMNIYLNRIALSQPQLMFFFRIGLGGFFFSTWKWENIIDSNSYLLENYADKILSKNEKLSTFIIFLPEMEHIKENSFINTIEWPEYISKKEFDYNTDKIDYYLSFVIKGLQDANQKEIIIMPYNKKNNSLNQAKGYSHSFSQEVLLTPEIIYQKLIKKSPNTNCNSMFFNFELTSHNQGIQNKFYFLMDTIDSKKDNFPVIKKDFYLSIKEAVKYGVLCQNESGLSYIVLRREGIFNKGNYINKFSYKNIHNQIFINVDNKLKKYESEKLLAARSYKNFEKMNPITDGNLNDFYKQFDVFQIIIGTPIGFKTLSELDKEQFIKKYGSEVKSKFYSYIQYSIK